MASSTPTTADSMVTLKVNFQGITRRAKMPLREMIPSVLESQIRTFLHIPAGIDTVIERYSDSASTYVVLDPANMTVYKQLYRAAKAKSKLKLRVTIRNDKPAPKPVTVEDESENVASGAEKPAENQPEEIKEEPTTQAVEQEQTPSAASTTTKTETEIPADQTAQSSNKNIYHPPMYPYNNKPCLVGRDHRALPARFSSKNAQIPLLQAVNAPSTARCNPTFAICCNSCEKTIPDTHYHCSTCDDGDFDLCESCVSNSITCYSSDHWLIKRTMRNGQIINSTTETIPPKPKVKKEEPQKELPPLRTVVPMSGPSSTQRSSTLVSALPPHGKLPQLPQLPQLPLRSKPIYGNARTCNCCVEERPENEFLHCNDCEDYDLCKSCFQKDGHGHHPKHGFSPAVAGTQMPDHITVKMAAGRNQTHNAICDGCDKKLTGVRHKCLDCPDWDYCGECVKHAGFVHPNHRFVPVYDSIMGINRVPAFHSVHLGICCDGPLCSVGKGYPAYIRGIRYKCAICHDLDFCANCEASPANDHNKTHPLIKFKTPVRNVSVTTSGEHHDGQRMPAMGDHESAESKPAEAFSATDVNSINTVRTVVDVKPAEPEVEPKEEVEIKQEKVLTENDLQAVFVRDSVVDGTILPPNRIFEQTWTLKNEGEVAWPAGCSVNFVGGDYMGHVDSAHPADVAELMSAAESTVCNSTIAPGQEHSFTVLLRTPARPGKIISYWRLTTQDGLKFGNRLWCDVNVRAVKTEPVAKAVSPVVEPKEEPKEEIKEEPKEESNKAGLMIFPKLEKESPVSSIHEEAPAKPASTEAKSSDGEDFEDCAEDEEWDASDDGFLTDEEYDILDASDEEFLEEQQKKLQK